MTTHALRQEMGRVRERAANYSAIRSIQEAVSDRFGVSLIDLVASRREARSITPRHVAMWLARRTGATFPTIGEAFGFRHHTTVMHAVRKVEKQLVDDPELADRVSSLMVVVDRLTSPDA